MNHYLGLIWMSAPVFHPIKDSHQITVISFFSRTSIPDYLPEARQAILWKQMRPSLLEKYALSTSARNLGKRMTAVRSTLWLRSSSGSFWYGNEPNRSRDRCIIGMASMRIAANSRGKVLCKNFARLFSDQTGTN